MNPILDKALEVIAAENDHETVGVSLIIASPDGTYNIHNLYANDEDADILHAIIIDHARSLIEENPMWGAGPVEPDAWLHGTPGITRIH